MKLPTVLLGLLVVFVAGFAGPCRAEAQAKVPVWIDTDPSVARGGREVDDGFALIQAFHSPELEVRGVSVVFGNAPLPTAWPIGAEIVAKFGPKGLHAYKGAVSGEDLGKETEASAALERALQKERLTILALGPVTNVATVLKLHPDLAKNVVRIIAVAGRRHGQRFVASPSQAQAFRDFNFELDPIGFQVLLDSGISIVLAPWEVSSKVWIKRKDLERLDKGGPGARYLVPPALDWLEWWHKNLGTDGFNPFDTLAVTYLTSPGLLQCSDFSPQIMTAPDDVTADAGARTKPYLYVSDLKPGRSVTYCYNTLPQFKEDLLVRLLRKAEH
jgi:inosine-uridine nucleoside N-ribohydrolase